MKVILFSPNGYIGGFIKERILREKDIRLFEITRNTNLEQYDEDYDVLIYSAAVSDASIEQYVQDNVIMALTMAKFSNEHQISRIIYLSTDSIYGELNVDEVNDKTMMIDPDVYGTTKYLAEKILIASGIPYYILRMPGVVGKVWRNNFICNTMLKIKNNEDIKLYNAERKFNNILDIEDLSEFIICLCNQINSDISEIFLLGNTQTTKLRDLVLYMKTIYCSESEIININSDSKRCFVLNTAKAVKFGYVSKSIKTIIDNLYLIQQGGSF